MQNTSMAPAGNDDVHSSEGLYPGFLMEKANIVCSWESGGFEMDERRFIQLFTLLWQMPDGRLYLTKEQVKEAQRTGNEYPFLAFVERDSSYATPISIAAAIDLMLTNVPDAEEIIMTNFHDFVKEHGLECFIKEWC